MISCFGLEYYSTFRPLGGLMQRDYLHTEMQMEQSPSRPAHPAGTQKPHEITASGTRHVRQISCRERAGEELTISADPTWIKSISPHRDGAAFSHRLLILDRAGSLQPGLGLALVGASTCARPALGACRCLMVTQRLMGTSQVCGSNPTIFRHEAACVWPAHKAWSKLTDVKPGKCGLKLVGPLSRSGGLSQTWGLLTPADANFIT